jgi:hypothetical protein
MNAATPAASTPAPATNFCAPEDGNGVPVEVGLIGVPVGLLPAVVAAVLLWPVGSAYPDDVPTETGAEVVLGRPPATTLKLAHPMRVLLDRWTTMERLPK